MTMIGDTSEFFHLGNYGEMGKDLMLDSFC